VLGYIVAGFLVGPHMALAPTVVDKADVQTWADIGVMFLLFSLGLDFSFRKILKMGGAPFIAAFIIIFFMMVLGMTVGYTFGWSRMDCLFLGGMLAMSSTTIIYKAFTDMGLMQQQFTGMVMSVLILEDILAIVMMVLLSALARGAADGGELARSILSIVFFLVLWFVVGLFVIPLFLRLCRKLINDETLLIVSLGLCCGMAVISNKVGFSSAFGAFVMGSILSETLEGEHIEHLVSPVKDLFGAVFFVSVGMLVDPQILVGYATPILVLVLTILAGQAVFGSLGYLLSGSTLLSAMRSGFSMAQIGEFSFIIASLGLSLGVISDFLYPVIVAVSVITTFLTPYMIRLATPAYHAVNRVLPQWVSSRLDSFSSSQPVSVSEENAWHPLLRSIVVNVVVYSILATAAIFMMLTFFLPFIRGIMGEHLHWWANGICAFLTLLLIAPFLRAIVIKKSHGKQMVALWQTARANRPIIISVEFIRLLIASAFIFYIFNYLTRFGNALMLTVAILLAIILALSRSVRRRGLLLEQVFMANLHSKEARAVALGQHLPDYAANLRDRNIHISDFVIPLDSRWAGKTLRQLSLRSRFGVHVSSVLRGGRRLNTPGGDTEIFPDDKIEAIGSDEQLTAFQKALGSEVYPADDDIEKREMHLRQLVIAEGSPLVGVTLEQSGIRDKYGCMVVGLEQGKRDLTPVNPSRRFRAGDVIWLVGERDALRQIRNLNKNVQ